MYMSKEVEVITPLSTLGDAIKKMTNRKIRRLVVARGETVVGMIGRNELINAFPHHVNPFSPLGPNDDAASKTVEMVMTSPVITIEESAPIEKAAALMTKHHVGGLPVTHEGRLVGIITESDIFRALTRLLSDHDDAAVRITFDLTENENILTFLDEMTRKHGVMLLSFISFHKGERRMAVVRVKGEEVQPFIDDLWQSGHRVVNII
jgi:acetoin utilization protein AcuB